MANYPYKRPGTQLDDFRETIIEFQIAVEQDLRNSQGQIRKLVAEGDSSPQAAAAAVDITGKEHETLKDRLDSEQKENIKTKNDLTAAINEKAKQTDLSSLQNVVASKRSASEKIKNTDLDTTSDANKIKLVNLSDEVQKALTGNAPALSTIPNAGVTKEKLAPNVVEFDKLGVTVLRGDIINGSINVDMVNKTISTPGCAMTSNTTNRSIAAQNLAYTGSIVNLFYNLSTNLLEVYTAGNLTGATSAHNHLVLLATIYNGKLYNLLSTTAWSINNVPMYKPIFSQQPALFTGGTTYGGYKGITEVQFDEVNKTITFPKNGCIVQGNKMYILPEDVVITPTNTLTMRTLILFDTVTKQIYIKHISGDGHIPGENDLMLGSFLFEINAGKVKFKNIQGNFPYNVIKEASTNITIPSVWAGKKGNFWGDSITEGGYGNYVNVVKNILGLSVANNYGIGGSRLCYSGDTAIDEQYPPLISRYQTGDKEADFEFFLITTNDYSSQIPLGAANSTNPNEVNGALNIIMKWLRENRPDKLIIFASPIHRYNDLQHPVKMPAYRAAIKDRCADHKHVFFDLYAASGFDFVAGYYDKVLTPDGLHPNQKGADMIGRKTAGFINIH